ncbi:uncharacterized protein EV422DRAFT_30641 [Fimicolochytrium jonesii]|uniref:uncharacterized protein n=1 Tax=Fimicolochytrium jonesii TaxID=1396493 RepID=UPI0022FEC36E|nr:uncharacterized protein EV422DRAFT_30641 [Fimicolochytrium jonesii]KAI8827189.1 hypothetical protein EV422DRAFT_30641 [Fimicolochytrium jonesii]
MVVVAAGGAQGHGGSPRASSRHFRPPWQGRQTDRRRPCLPGLLDQFRPSGATLKGVNKRDYGWLQAAEAEEDAERQRRNATLEAERPAAAKQAANAKARERERKAAANASKQAERAAAAELKKTERAATAAARKEKEAEEKERKKAARELKAAETSAETAARKRQVNRETYARAKARWTPEDVERKKAKQRTWWAAGLKCFKCKEMNDLTMANGRGACPTHLAMGLGQTSRLLAEVRASGVRGLHDHGRVPGSLPRLDLIHERLQGTIWSEILRSGGRRVEVAYDYEFQTGVPLAVARIFELGWAAALPDGTRQPPASHFYEDNSNAKEPEEQFLANFGDTFVPKE